MNNGNGNPAANTVDYAKPNMPAPGRLPAPSGHKRRNTALLWKMLAVAIGVHVLLIALTSTSLFSDDPNTPEKVFEQAESAMQAGKYLEAMDLYQQVLDKQPKLPPVFERAAEQHRNADRMAKQQAAKLTATQPAVESPTTPPTAAAGAAATKPADPVKVAPPVAKPEFEVPPELRGK